MQNNSEKQYASVSGLNICFSGFDMSDEGFSCWNSFLSASVPEPDLIFRYEFEADNTYCLSPLVFKAEKNNTLITIETGINYKPDIKMIANKDWSDISIHSKSNAIPPYELKLMTDAAFRSRISYYSGFVSHASVICYKGEAIIFTASSGVGKSTHAELWRNHIGAEIINGDHAIIRMVNNRPYVYGAPWSGTSPYTKNMSAPLKAIVILEQSKNNEIIKLSPTEAVMGIISHCQLPSWNGSLMEKTIENIGKALTNMKVYKLKCTPEKEAAFLVRNTVFI